MRPAVSHSAAMDAPSTPPAPRWLLVVGIVALAFNLRPAAVSVGPVLNELRASLHMSATVAGLLTTMPVLAFALFGAAAPALARSVGARRVTLASLLAVVAGLLLRATTSSATLFLGFSLLALAGMATANVLLPSLIKQHFPERVGFMTSLYTTAMAIGLTLASVLTVPFTAGRGPDGWRVGLGVWAVTAAVAVLPWVALTRGPASKSVATRTASMRDVARTRLGRVMALAFGLQSLQAYAIFGWFAQVYRDAGFPPETAGLLLGIITAVGIPLSFVIPARAGQLRDQRALLAGLMACYPVGYVGLMLAPASHAYLWAVVLGVATAVFPLVLTLIGLRARTGEGTAALSGFTQGAGYLLATVGPFGIGALYDATGAWDVPLGVLLALTVPQLWVGLAAARPGYIEDELAQVQAPPAT